MSTSQYGVRVLEKDGPAIVLQVFSISEDTPVPPEAENTDVFVRFLCEPRGRKRSPLDARIERDDGDPFDDAWLAENASHYVTRVEALRSENLTAQGRFSSYSARKRQFVDEAELAQTTFRLTLADEKLASHLAVGDAWESAAYVSSGAPAALVGDTDPEALARAKREHAEYLQEAERGAAVHLALVDATLAEAGIASWRTSALSSGSYQFVLQGAPEMKAAVKALKAKGFTARANSKTYCWLVRDATGVVFTPWEHAKVMSFVIDVTQQSEKARAPKQPSAALRAE
jgi:hypothetical protein